MIDLKLTKEQFFDLTPWEFSCLSNYYFKSQKDNYSIIRNVIYNAASNLLRKKGQPEIKLFEDSKKNNKDNKDILKERQELFG